MGRLFAFVLLCVALFFQETQSQEPHQPQQQQQALNRETIEAIFQQMSPACRSEMEAAMESAQTQSTPGEVSDVCKEEIQKSVAFVTGSGQGQPQGPGGGSADGQRSGGDDSSPKSNTQSIVLVVAALLVLFGAVVGYVIYFNMQQGNSGAPKKSSKRKDKKTR